MCNLLGLPFEIPYKMRETDQGTKIFSMATVTLDEGGNIAIQLPEPGILQLTRPAWRRLTARIEDQVATQQEGGQSHG